MLKHSKETKQEVINAFIKYIETTDDVDIKFAYSPTKKIQNKDKVTILYAPIAYLKMRELILSCSTEIAWYGLIHRVNKQQFFVKDIVMYPQIVTAATVEDDDDSIHQWFAKQPDEVVNSIRLQGHSHVRMSTTPSGTDMANRDKLISGVNDFFIFQINNKDNTDKYWMYDLKDNLLYEPDDINVGVTFKDKDNKVKTLFDWYTENTEVNIKKKIKTNTVVQSTSASKPSKSITLASAINFNKETAKTSYTELCMFDKLRREINK